MAQWKRRTPERDGTYRFDGQFLVTHRVSKELSTAEITFIYLEIKQAVETENGLDYLQVFTDESDRKLYFIDQVNDGMKASKDFLPDDNHCTLLFAEEY